MASEGIIPVSELETGMVFVFIAEAQPGAAEAYPAWHEPHVAVARHELITGMPGERWEGAAAYSTRPDLRQNRLVLSDTGPGFPRVQTSELVRVTGRVGSDGGLALPLPLDEEAVSILRVLAWHGKYMSAWEPVVRAETVKPDEYDIAAYKLVDSALAVRWRAGNVYRMELTGLGVAEVISRDLFYAGS